MNTELRGPQILLVDDDQVDRMAVVRSFRKAGINNEIIEAEDGIEALAALGRLHESGVKPKILILLDLSMPRMDGIEFLKRLRADKQLGLTTTFVLTTSHAEEDKLAAYREHIAGYIVKSNLRNELMRVVDMLRNYSEVIAFP